MSLSEPDFESYKEQCTKDVAVLQDAFMKLYDINSYEKWFYDHGTGAFHFKSDNEKNLYFKYVSVGTSQQLPIRGCGHGIIKLLPRM